MKWKVEYITDDSSNILTIPAEDIIGCGFPLKLAEHIVKSHNESLDKAAVLLKQHHKWHLDFIDVPKEFVGMNMALEYSDSNMCDETINILREIGE